MNYTTDEWSISPLFMNADRIGAAPSVVFFANITGSLIGRLDPATDVVTAWTLPTILYSIFDIKFVRDYVFIANPAFSLIAQLNPTTSKVTEWTLPLGQQPAALASDSQGNIYFAGKMNSGLSAIGQLNDSTKEFKVWTIPTGLAALDTNVDALAVDLNGDVFFPVWGSIAPPTPKHGIGRLNPRTNTFTGWQTSNMPLSSLGINPAGLVYFLEQDSGLVGPFRMARLNPNTNSLTEWIYSGLPPISSLAVNLLGGVFFPLIGGVMARFDPQRSYSRAIRRTNFGRVRPVTTAARGVIGHAATSTIRAAKTSQTIQATTAGAFTTIPLRNPSRSPAQVCSNASGEVFFTEFGVPAIGRLR